MDMKENLQEQYLNFSTKKRASDDMFLKRWMKFSFFVATPIVGLSLYLMVQASYTLRNMGYTVGIAYLIFLGFYGYKQYQKEKTSFKEGPVWEATLTSYLKASGVDTETLSPEYKYSKLYYPEGKEGEDGLVYFGEAKINGAVSQLEVRMVAGKLGAYTPSGELLPDEK